MKHPPGGTLESGKSEGEVELMDPAMRNWASGKQKKRTQETTAPVGRRERG